MSSTRSVYAEACDVRRGVAKSFANMQVRPGVLMSHRGQTVASTFANSKSTARWCPSTMPRTYLLTDTINVSTASCVPSYRDDTVLKFCLELLIVASIQSASRQQCDPLNNTL